MAGKLGCRGVISAVRPGRLFYVTDSVSGRRYIVDTGSAFSIMPWESTAIPSGPSLTAADGRHIPCWGERPFAVTIAGVARRWDFLLAAVSFPIIGIDFLHHHGLLVDVANLRLLAGPPPPAAVCAITGAPETARPCSYAEVAAGRPLPPTGSSPPSPGSSPPSPATPPTLPPSADWVTALRHRFPAVFTASSATSVVPPPHGVQQLITTIGQPCTARFRRLDPSRLAAAKAEFQAMLDEGVIRRSISQWSSPHHMVRKKDSSWRPCGDYRHLNLQMVGG